MREECQRAQTAIESEQVALQQVVDLKHNKEVISEELVEASRQLQEAQRREAAAMETLTEKEGLIVRLAEEIQGLSAHNVQLQQSVADGEAARSQLMNELERREEALLVEGKRVRTLKHDVSKAQQEINRHKLLLSEETERHSSEAQKHRSETVTLQADLRNTQNDLSTALREVAHAEAKLEEEREKRRNAELKRSHEDHHRSSTSTREKPLPTSTPTHSPQSESLAKQIVITSSASQTDSPEGVCVGVQSRPQCADQGSWAAPSLSTSSLQSEDILPVKLSVKTSVSSSCQTDVEGFLSSSDACSQTDEATWVPAKRLEESIISVRLLTRKLSESERGRITLDHETTRLKNCLRKATETLQQSHSVMEERSKRHVEELDLCRATICDLEQKLTAEKTERDRVVSHLNAAVDDKSRSLEEVKAELMSSDAARSIAERELGTLRQNITTLQSATRQLREVERQLVNEQEKNADLRSEMQSHAEEKQQLREECQKQASTCRLLLDQVTSLQKQVEAAQRSGMSSNDAALSVSRLVVQGSSRLAEQQNRFEANTASILGAVERKVVVLESCLRKVSRVLETVRERDRSNQSLLEAAERRLVDMRGRVSSFAERCSRHDATVEELQRSHAHKVAELRHALAAAADRSSGDVEALENELREATRSFQAEKEGLEKRVRFLEEELNREKDLTRTLEASLEDEREKIISIEKSRQGLQSSLDAASAKHETARNELYSSVSQCQSVQREKDVLEKELRSLVDRYSTLMDASDETIRGLEQQIHALKRESSRVREQKVQSEGRAASLDEQNQVLRIRVRELDDENALHQRRLGALEDERSELLEQVVLLKRQRDDHEREVSNIRRKLEGLSGLGAEAQARTHAIQRERDLAEENAASLQEQLEVSEAKYEAVSIRLAALQGDVMRKESVVASLETRVTEMEEAARAFQSEHTDCAQVRRLLNRKEDRVETLERDLLALRNAHATVSQKLAEAEDAVASEKKRFANLLGLRKFKNANA